MVADRAGVHDRRRRRPIWTAGASQVADRRAAARATVGELGASEPLRAACRSWRSRADHRAERASSTIALVGVRDQPTTAFRPATPARTVTVRRHGRASRYLRIYSQPAGGSSRAPPRPTRRRADDPHHRARHAARDAPSWTRSPPSRRAGASRTGRPARPRLAEPPGCAGSPRRSRPSVVVSLTDYAADREGRAMTADEHASTSTSASTSPT